MNLRLTIAVLGCATALVLPSAAVASYSVGTGEQIAWVRRAASNFVSAELTDNGTGACAVLAAPLRATQHHRTCAQRWDTRLAKLLREPGERTRLRRSEHTIHSAPVIVHGNIAFIDLPAPLIGGQNRFRWTENCWMLEG